LSLSFAAGTKRALMVSVSVLMVPVKEPSSVRVPDRSTNRSIERSRCANWSASAWNETF